MLIPGWSLCNTSICSERLLSALPARFRCTTMQVRLMLTCHHMLNDRSHSHHRRSLLRGHHSHRRSRHHSHLHTRHGRHMGHGKGHGRSHRCEGQQGM
jgi:hypothetical protein